MCSQLTATRLCPCGVLVYGVCGCQRSDPHSRDRHGPVSHSRPHNGGRQGPQRGHTTVFYGHTESVVLQAFAESQMLTPHIMLIPETDNTLSS